MSLCLKSIIMPSMEGDNSMLLPVNVHDSFGLFQTGFKITSFSHMVHGDEGSIYDSVDLELVSNDGQTATASVVFVTDEEPRPGSYDEAKSSLRLDTIPAAGGKILDILYRAAGCGAAEVHLGIQYDTDRVIGDFWVEVRVVLGAGGSVH